MMQLVLLSEKTLFNFNKSVFPVISVNPNYNALAHANMFGSTFGSSTKAKVGFRLALSVVVKLVLCPTANLLSLPYLHIAGHMTTRRGPDVILGPDIDHHWIIRKKREGG